MDLENQIAKLSLAGNTIGLRQMETGLMQALHHARENMEAAMLNGRDTSSHERCIRAAEAQLASTVTAINHMN